MDYVFIILGVVLMLSGIIGSILPVLPGPPLSYIGLLLLHFTENYHFAPNILITWGIITAVVYALDFAIPAFGTRRSGGSKRGVWGSVIGLIAGLFLFPLGIIIGPFVGAVIGELSSGKDSNSALRSGFGSFMGFLTGTILKLITSGIMLWLFGKELFFN
ncbi:MAG: DUF456 domain-containing protein [Candidatus Marinimicrobia bacterium]|nr:DUF456 domain-containing protein [Candidatus Neomarinimicrobiota bacterium]